MRVRTIEGLVEVLAPRTQDSGYAVVEEHHCVLLYAPEPHYRGLGRWNAGVVRGKRDPTDPRIHSQRIMWALVLVRCYLGAIA